MPWAHVANGVVVEIVATDPTGLYHPSLDWVACDATVQQRWTYDGHVFAAPVAPARTTADAVAQLRSILAAQEATGVVFTPTGASAPIHFPTTDAAIVRYNAEWSAIAAQLRSDGDAVIASDGSPVSLSNVDAGNLIKLALGKFRACSAHYASLYATVQANPATDITQGWPA